MMYVQTKFVAGGTLSVQASRDGEAWLVLVEMPYDQVKTIVEGSLTSDPHALTVTTVVNAAVVLPDSPYTIVVKDPTSPSTDTGSHPTA